MICCYSGVPDLNTGSLNLIWSQNEIFSLISGVVDCVNVNPSARLNHVLRDAQKVCALTIVGTVLKRCCFEHHVFDDVRNQNSETWVSM